MESPNLCAGFVRPLISDFILIRSKQQGVKEMMKGINERNKNKQTYSN